MKKRFLLVLLLISCVLVTSACSKDNKKALEFKDEYESLNGKTNSRGMEHRTVSISKDNPYVKISPEDIVKKIENKETFYLYVGDPLCPWCRSVLEKSIEVAKRNNIDTIYYIKIWDEEGNEIFRDKYELKDGETNKIVDGTDSYYKLLEYFDSVLSDYTLTGDDGEKVNVSEKRIFAPNYFYVKDGKVVKKIDGISDKQEDPRAELTKEILADEEDMFNELFKN